MPFQNVYFTGIVRDKLGRKMSKSLGNSPDPLDLIEKYGADGVRMGMMLSAPAGNDILFDDALCEQGRNFNNKIWNAFRLIKGWEVSAEVPVPEASELAIRWFEAKQNEVAAEVADLFSKYRLSEALMAVYKLFWDEFSSWYLEMIKPAYGQPINRKVYEATIGFFDNLLHLLHPFMPFITEELWQHLCDRTDGESLMVSPLSMSALVDEDIIREFEVVKEVISNIRSIRLQKNIAQKETLELQVIGENPVVAFNAVIMKMCNLSSINIVENKADGAASFMVGTTEYAVPLGNMIDVEAEIARMEAELKHKEGFLQGVLKKLGNEKFVNNAPAAVLEMERKKQADAESIIKSLRKYCSIEKGITVHHIKQRKSSGTFNSGAFFSGIMNCLFEQFCYAPHQACGGVCPDFLVSAVILHREVGFVLIFECFDSYGHGSHNISGVCPVKRRIVISVSINGTHGKRVVA